MTIPNSGSNFESIDEWLKGYYGHAGSEIGVAFGAINANMGWAIALISLLVTGIFLSGIFPDIRSFVALLLVSLLVIRFFVRTTLAYQNLIRWNIFRNLIDRIFLGTDADGSIHKDLLAKIDLYDWKWFSPQPRGKLIQSNLKYGYWYLFLFIYALAGYAWMSLDKSTLLAPSPSRSLAFAAILVTAFFTLGEIKGFFDPPYFKHPRFAGNGDKSHEQNKSKNNKQRETSSQRLTWKRVLGKRSRVVLYGLALLLLAGSVGFLESTSSRETILRSDGFATTVRDFGVSLPIRLVGGDELSLSWSSNESASIAIMDPFALQMFNQTGVLTNLINLSQGQSGNTRTTMNSQVTAYILVSTDSLSRLTIEIQIKEAASFGIGALIGVASLIPLVVLTYGQSIVIRREEKM